MSLALARKYRPKRFADVAVQSHVSATLKGAIARGRVAHGYLLCGPRGVGKTTLARVLAMALNCENRGADGEPCGECASCQRIWSGASSLDVVEIDAASNRGVDDARELRERAMYAPSGEERYKVYIVDEAHMLTREAWNALLKILEEPPPRVVFVFATTEPQKIAQSAAPVLSRLQRFDFKRIGTADIKERLAHVFAAESIDSDADALAMIARAADGSMRDALSLADQVLAMGDGRVTADRVRDSLGLVAEDELLALLDLVAARRAAEVFPFVTRLAESGIDFGGFLTALADMLRAQLAIVLGGSAADMSEHARAALEARREQWSASDLLRMLAALGELEPRIRKSGQPQLLIETLLVRFALLDRTVEIEDLLRGLAEGGGGRERGAEPGGVAADPRPREVSSSPRPGVQPPRSLQPPPADLPLAPPRPTTLADVSRPVAAVRPEREAPVAPLATLELARLTARWDDLIAHLRAEGRHLLATALEHALPVAVTAAGEVNIELTEPNEIHERAIENGRADVVTALGHWFADVRRVHLRKNAERAAATPPRRVTDEMVRSDRLTALRKRDPLLGAAIDTLDLDVVD
jgi:DNA polymerase-3 subunit gamma/tau